jgi:predicted NodU family carbamoyl transferase
VNILGINCFSHDTAACLLQDGQVAAFVEEERFNREKHTKAFPDRAIPTPTISPEPRVGGSFEAGSGDPFSTSPGG